METQIGPICFSSNFDSGNLRHVEQVEKHAVTGGAEEKNYIELEAWDLEYNLWTSLDAADTPYENGNRTWFYFSTRGQLCYKSVKFNMMNLNKQSKLYAQGMSPVFRILPSKNSKWQRVREKPTWEMVDGQFRMSFVHRFIETQARCFTYFAFCYPFSYQEGQQLLDALKKEHALASVDAPTDIYFHRDILCYSKDGLNVDVLTVSSTKNMTNFREPHLPHLYPDANTERAHVFKNKKLFFLSSRVHPGETPASFVFNGFLKFILRRDDERAAVLRDHFVFKMVPMINPDGVKRGHYRTDKLGVNLNRMYVDPDPVLHPSVYGIKSLMMYFTGSRESDSNNNNNNNNNNNRNDSNSNNSLSSQNTIDNNNNNHNNINNNNNNNNNNSTYIDSSSLCKPCCKLKSDNKQHSFTIKETDNSCTIGLQKSANYPNMSISDTGFSSGNYHSSSPCESQVEDENGNFIVNGNVAEELIKCFNDSLDLSQSCEEQSEGDENASSVHSVYNESCTQCGPSVTDSKTAVASQIGCKRTDVIYVDLHGHASKRGCFIYGNYYEHDNDLVQCMLFPKLIAVNTAHFDFQACNFSERNMYHRDKRDGMSKEGSGRVSIAKACNILHSYTLECNYNSGKMTNCIPPATCDEGRATPPPLPGFPPRYTIEHYEEVGRAVAIAALDMFQINPWSRLPLSEFKSLNGVRDSLVKYIRSAPRCVLGNRKEKNAKAKSKWISPSVLLRGGLMPSHPTLGQGSMTKVNEQKKSMRTKGSLPSVSNHQSNTKIYHQKLQHHKSTRSAPMQMETTPKLEKTLSPVNIANAKVTGCILQQLPKQNKIDKFDKKPGLVTRSNPKHTNASKIREVLSSTHPLSSSCAASWNNKVAQIPSIVNLSPLNPLVEPVVDVCVKKETDGGKVNTKRNGVRPMRISVKKKSPSDIR